MAHTFPPPSYLVQRCLACGVSTRLAWGTPCRIRVQSAPLSFPSEPKDKGKDKGPPVCECGAHSSDVADFAPGHSSWCPVVGKAP